MRKKFKKIIYTSAVILTVCILSGVGRGITKADLYDEQAKEEELEKELEDAQSILDSLESLKSDTTAYIESMDLKLNEIAQNIIYINGQIEDKQAEIDATNIEIENEQAEVDSQYDAMKIRIKFMYENGNSQMLDMFFGTDSIGEFLKKAEYITELTTYDRQMLDKLKEAVDLLEQSKAKLEQEEAELETLKGDAEAEQAEVEVLLAAKEEELANTNAQIDEANKDISAKQTELQEQQNLIAQMEAIEERKRVEEEAARQAAEALAAAEASKQAEDTTNSTNTSNGSSTNSGSSSGSSYIPTYDGGIFAWPLRGYTTISSDYSSRISPISGQQENHNGIDIPAPIGTPIYAVYDGTVEWAWLSSSAGNWMGIYHGNGIYSVYMHMSAFAVSSGTYVHKGDLIGYVGSTGWSTGPHLHLSIRVNGSYVNPHIYVG